MRNQTSKQKGTKQNEHQSWKGSEKEKKKVFLAFEVKPIVSTVLQNFLKDQFISIQICLQK